MAKRQKTIKVRAWLDEFDGLSLAPIGGKHQGNVAYVPDWEVGHTMDELFTFEQIVDLSEDYYLEETIPFDVYKDWWDWKVEQMKPRRGRR